MQSKPLLMKAKRGDEGVLFTSVIGLVLRQTLTSYMLQKFMDFFFKLSF